MIKDELKNRISMALKDPVLQQGFEIICKNLAELEEENRLMQLKLDALDGYIPWDEIADSNEQIKNNLQLKQENAVLKKALHLYIDWADECDIAWDNFPDMKEKWWKVVEEKGLGWIDGLIFMVIEEAKEQLLKEEQDAERLVQTDDKDKACH